MGSVDLRFIPRVINFLGYNPIPQPEDLLKKLAWYKQVNGLSLERLGIEMGCLAILSSWQIGWVGGIFPAGGTGI